MAKLDAEREVWIGEYQNSGMILGQVISATYNEREAVWRLASPLLRLSSLMQCVPSKYQGGK